MTLGDSGGSAQWAAVALGGAAGALARVVLEPIFSVLALGLFVWIVPNLAGAFALGWVAARWRETHPARYRAVGVGFLGSFTTVSAWALGLALVPARWGWGSQGDDLFSLGLALSWLVIGPGFLGLGVLAAGAGLRLGHPPGEG